MAFLLSPAEYQQTLANIRRTMSSVEGRIIGRVPRDDFDLPEWPWKTRLPDHDRAGRSGDGA